MSSELYRVVWKEEEKRLVKKSINYVSLQECIKFRDKLKKDGTGLPVWIEDKNCKEYKEE